MVLGSDDREQLCLEGALRKPCDSWTFRDGRWIAVFSFGMTCEVRWNPSLRGWDPIINGYSIYTRQSEDEAKIAAEDAICSSADRLVRTFALDGITPKELKL